jgi:hypothetical protein
MAKQALATLETALRARKLDRTLTSALPSLDRHDAPGGNRVDRSRDTAPTGADALDASLRGGFPRGQLSEIAGPASSGRTTLALQTMAAATGRGELAAFIDTFDRLDVASAAAAGIDLDRLLWIRGSSGPPEGAIERALKALNLVLQAGGFGCVMLDLADAPLIALRRLPFTTWLRIQRVVEGRDTACVLLTPQPLARSAGGLTLSLAARTRWAGDADRNRHLTGADVSVRIVSPRRRVEGEVEIRANAIH